MKLNIYSKPSSATKGRSYIGGSPLLPKDFQWPSCELCGADLEFFFQIELPKPHPLAGKLISVFFCVDCVDEDYLIPEMLPDIRRGHSVPDGFLDAYQRNFRVLVFDSNEELFKSNKTSSIVPRRLEINNAGDGDAFGQIGTKPLWLTQDESPSHYGDNTKFSFLFQLSSGLVFRVFEDAKRQIELNLKGQPEPSQEDYYQLFLGNETYFWGTISNPCKIYVITQI